MTSSWNDRFSPRMAQVRASEIRELLKLLDQPDILSFAGGIPDPALFPTARIAELYGEVLAEAGDQALQYSVSEGLPALRRWIAARMTAQGAPCDEGNIVITAGSQQALDLIGKLFIGRGDAVLVERPTYMGALGAFNAYEPSYADLEGDVPAGARLAYVVPDFANPSGRTMPRREREALLARATAHDLVVIEDAAYRDLRFTGTDEPSLLALDVARSGGIEGARTLYCGTFSKTLSPALRLGWVCGPRAVIDKLVLLKQGCDPTFVAVAFAWAAGEGFADVVEAEDLSGGDFVRTTKQLIDLLRQLAIVAPERATRQATQQASDALFRGVVAASSALEEETTATDDPDGSDGADPEG